MKLRSRKWEEPELNIINFVDVMLMLLVFFMMTTHFIQNTSLTVVLPTASAASASTELKGLEVTIDAQGHYYVNRQAVDGTSPEAVRAALLAAAGDRRDLPIILRADARSSNQSVVTVMSVAGELGFTQLQILTTQPPAEH
jgi:biopolymer transport protein ExbD